MINIDHYQVSPSFPHVNNVRINNIGTNLVIVYQREERSYAKVRNQNPLSHFIPARLTRTYVV